MRKRKITLAGVALAATALVPAGTAVAHAGHQGVKSENAQTRTPEVARAGYHLGILKEPQIKAARLVPVRIHCETSSDGGGTDEPYLESNTGVTIYGPGSISEGQSLNIRGKDFNAGENIYLFDDDAPLSDDYLGGPQVNGPGAYTYTGDGAKYTVDFAYA